MMSQNPKTKLVILISNAGTGTNLQAIIDGVKNGKINAEICAVISDKADAPALEHARKSNLKIEISATKEDMLPILLRNSPDYLCLGGWKQVLLDEVLNKYENRIINIHPGLIPNTMEGVIENPDGTDAVWNKGKFTIKAIQNFLDLKATYAGASAHFLTHEFDFGPVLGRTFEKIESNDTVESLYARLKKKENELYVEVLEKLGNE